MPAPSKSMYWSDHFHKPWSRPCILSVCPCNFLAPFPHSFQSRNILFALEVFMPSPTLYACQTRIPCLSKEKSLYLVTPGILLLPRAAVPLLYSPFKYCRPAVRARPISRPHVTPAPFLTRSRVSTSDSRFETLLRLPWRY